MDPSVLNNQYSGWKAMILAAGLGTRLLPYTKYTPKALFPVKGKPIIDRTIRSLINAGCDGILINTHHLHHQIAAFIATQKYAIPVQTRYEPVILGTGGGIKNAADFFGDRPFIVMNSDIVADIPLERVFAFHGNHPDAVTMVLYDEPQVNTVKVDTRLRILGFNQPLDNVWERQYRHLTFTGIQVLDPEVLALIPDSGFSSIIDTYRRILRHGDTIRAYIADHCQWRDIGTPESYRTEVIGQLAPKAFEVAFGSAIKNEIHPTRLAGDGSDRHWYRMTAGNHTLIMADHGIRESKSPSEVDAFIDIGRHLRQRQVAVPELVAWDRFSGMVFIKDLGNKHLQAVVHDTTNPDQIVAIYQHVIDEWIRLATDGNDSFDPNWTYQTRRYNRDVIIGNECRYFVDAFLNGYLGAKIDESRFQAEFGFLADGIMDHAVDGLIHRDFQSRNIMIKDGRYYLIDFQGARFGPVQYDLASLLIDPYVVLPVGLQARLCHYGCDRFCHAKSIDRDRFITGYRYCALSRNLQILGAFGYLTRVKKKSQFNAYIPAAIRSLSRILDTFSPDEFPALKSVTNCIKKNM